MNANTNELISSTSTGDFTSSNDSDLTYMLSKLTTSGAYYLVISCENSSKQSVLSVRSNVVQINVTDPIITIGVKVNDSYDTASTTVYEGNTVPLTLLPTEESDY